MTNEKLDYEPVNSGNRVYNCDHCGNEVESLEILSGDDFVLCDDCLGKLKQ